MRIRVGGLFSKTAIVNCPCGKHSVLVRLKIDQTLYCPADKKEYSLSETQQLLTEARDDARLSRPRHGAGQRYY